MGSAFTNWEEAVGPIYMGANTSWEIIWTLVAAGCCILALILGSRHELDAYRRLDSNGNT